MRVISVSQDQQIPFRKHDDSIEWVSFSYMMERMDAQGFITLPSGELGRRARDLEPRPVASRPIRRQTKIVSDQLGFIDKCLPEMQAHLDQTGIKGVEFKPDPEVPGFTQVHCSSEGAKQKYMKARFLRDKNSRNGGGRALSEKDLADAKELVERSASHKLEGITNGC